MPDTDRPPFLPLFWAAHPHLFHELQLPSVMAHRLRMLMHSVGTAEQGNVPPAPGCVFVVRRDGQPFISLGHGWARAPHGGADDDHLPMTENTVVQTASMSKPITATAVLAMFDDWAAMFEQLQALPPAPAALPSGDDRTNLPAALLPISADGRVAARIVAESLQHRFPGDWKALIVAAAQRFQADSAGPHSSYPLLEGLLMSVLRGFPNRANAWLPADPNTIYVDLIDRRLRREAARLGLSVTYGGDLQLIAVSQFLKQASGMREEQEDDGPVSQPPDGGLATFDLWRRMISLLAGGSHHGGQYLNANYTALSALIEAVTELKYVDWVRYRVLNDTRFSMIGRRPEPNMLAAKYYGEDFENTPGVSFSDYTNWSGNGGWYVTAAQFTDWMHVLYSGAPYGHAGRPIVSDLNRGWLFEPGQAFTGGAVRSLIDAAGRHYQGYEHNGGAGVNGGSVSGKMSVIVPNRDGHVYTAFLLANGPVIAESLFDPMIATLMANLD